MHGSESDLHLSFRQCSDDRYGANTSSGIKGLNVKKFRQSFLGCRRGAVYMHEKPAACINPPIAVTNFLILLILQCLVRVRGSILIPIN